MTAAALSAHKPDPAIIFDTLNAYQRPAALKAAIELDLFSAIARGSRSADAIAQAVSASTRGVRILCDYLVISGFLAKGNDGYSLTADSAMFLDRSSPAYLGSAARFLLDPRLLSPFLNLGDVVRTGRTTLPEEGTVSRNNPIWVEFAKQMAPMIFPAASETADLVAGDGEMRVLDIAAGHGLFGIMIAQRNPMAQITALDWPNVVAVATENAAKFGVAERHTALPGDAFETEFGGPYDLILVTNFFHHFDVATCERLMRKVRASLTCGGRCVTLDFVPNDDRVSPPVAAGFAMMMLGTTAAGDAYTFAEYEKMFRNAGYVTSELHTLKTAPQTLIVSRE
ncbi:MAG TPA: class I SAM-dependent methyltransferase [Granulicella sp.]|jgi:ubiquinone/menaquinone biosynthesis C-methylase UbiE|nr:class I SAM-dependent methyltransferase [Granulicella sp.]